MSNVFVKRTTAPDRTDKRYINYQYGGLSIACAIDKQTGFVLENCVGYCHSRWLELMGATAPNWKIPACNAEDWYEIAQQNGFKVGMTPKLGAVACWKQGKTWNGSDGAGHVAIVEEINDNYDFSGSSSHYNGCIFDLMTFTKASGYAYKEGFVFLGFIYIGIDFEAPKPVTQLYYRVQCGAYLIKANAVRRMNELKAKGFSTYLVKVGLFYKVQVGAYTVRSNADYMLSQIQKAGYDAFITTEKGTGVSIN